jgi:membrane protein DedA with SNARE-associated domain
MEFLFNNESLTLWLLQYGSLLLFLLLVVGIIILPVPEETLMVLAGILMSRGSLNIPLTLLAAYAGSMCGITMSYTIGRLAGHYILAKYGSWGTLKNQLHKTKLWFERFGKWTLTIGYFVPGLRHFTGFTSGLSHMNFRTFALFAYSGAILWVTTFLSLGYFFGDCCFAYIENLELGLDLIILIIGLLIIAVIGYLIFRYYRNRPGS